MRFVKIWLGLCVLTLLALVVFSGELRKVVRMEGMALPHGPAGRASQQWPTLPDPLEGLPGQSSISVRPGDDWEMVWGAAEGLAPEEKAYALFRRAIEVNPKSAALHCRLGMLYADKVYLDREEIRLSGAYVAEDAKGPDREKVEAALRELEQAKRLEPRNGFLDVFSGYLLFSVGRDRDGMEALRSAVSKTYWNDHSREAGRAAIHTATKGAFPRALSGRFGWPRLSYGGSSWERRLASFLAGWGRQFEEKGRHPEAIERYRLPILIGQRLRTNSNSGFDLLTACSLGFSVVGRWRPGETELPPLDLPGVRPEARQFRPGFLPNLARSVRHNILGDLAQEGFFAYLSAHGGETVALQARAEFALGEEIRFGLRPRLAGTGNRRYAAWRSASLSLSVQTLLLLYLLESVSLALAAWLLLVLLRWRSWEGRWLSALIRELTWKGTVARVLIVGLLGGLAVDVFLLVWAAALEHHPRYHMVVASIWLAPAILMVIVSTLAVAFSCRGGEVAQLPRFPLPWLQTLTMDFLFAAATFLTLYLLFFIPVSVTGARLEALINDIFTRGELAVLLGR